MSLRAIGHPTGPSICRRSTSLVTLREAGRRLRACLRHRRRRGAPARSSGCAATISPSSPSSLEPEEPLAAARRAFYAGMNALADALAAHAPPERPITFDWPDAIRIDGVLVGGGRLGWPEGVAEDEVPPGWCSPA